VRGAYPVPECIRRDDPLRPLVASTLPPPSPPHRTSRSDSSETGQKARARLHAVCPSRTSPRGRGGLHPTPRCYNSLGGSSVGSPSPQHALLCRSGLLHSATRAAQCSSSMHRTMFAYLRHTYTHTHTHTHTDISSIRVLSNGCRRNQPIVVIDCRSPSHPRPFFSRPPTSIHNS